MVNLNEYINESILDDEDIQIADIKKLAFVSRKAQDSDTNKDAFGHPIFKGDFVLFIPGGSKANSVLTIGIIKNISAKKITVESPKNTTNVAWTRSSGWNASKYKKIGENDMITTYVYPSMLIKIDPKTF